MQPPTWDTAPPEPPPVTSCTDCGADLGGNRWRCAACVQAAVTAIAENPGRIVTPSMIAAVRARE